MKRSIISLSLCFLLFLAVSIISMPNGLYLESLAESGNDSINYISMGDSIAEGYGLEGYVGKGETDIVQNSYAQLIKNKLMSHYSNVNAMSFANSGDDSEDFLSKLENERIQSGIENADIITICIGANDILGPASNGLVGFIVNDEDISVELDAGLTKFSTNFPLIIERLNELNPSAKKIFTTAYNPYKELMRADNNITLTLTAQLFERNITISKEKMVALGSLAEYYIAGNNDECKLDASMDRIYGLNERMSGILNGVDVVTGEDISINAENCYLVDSKSLFDNYIGSNKLVNVNILELENNTLVVPMASAQKEILSHMDPHPTQEGHLIIYTAFEKLYDDNFVLVNFDYLGGVLNGKNNNIKIHNINTCLSDSVGLDVPLRAGYKFKGWITEESGETYWNFNNIVSNDLTLKAKWSELYVINFNSVGAGAIESQKLEAGEKIVEPTTPSKNGSSDVFGGWYYIGENNEPVFWDFENNTVFETVTLIAKWANSICSNSDLLIQEVNNLQTIEFTIDIYANIQWYVNGVAQAGETGSIFRYTPPAKAGQYRVYCEVNGIETKKHTVVINYITPTSIVVEITNVSDKNLYTFSIQNGNYLDGSKCVWYATVDQFSEEARQIGEGAECKARISSNCKVYVVYNNEECISNYLSVDPPMVISNTVYIIIGITIAIGLVVTLLTIISRRRYKNYY